MAVKLQDLIDIEQFQMLQDRLNEIYSFPSAIIDNEGKIITATAWQDVCTKFHRQNIESEKECIKSDRYIADHLHEANPAVSYRCPHGLIDNATPIVIEDVHYGNFFTGQFFLEPPDLNFFREQAKRYGFDEGVYLEAVKKVPIWSQEQLNSYLFFIKGLIEVISGIGLKNLKEVESGEKIRESEERHRTILQTAMDGIWRVDVQGRLLEVNHAYCRMSGYNEKELLTMRVPDLEVVETAADTTGHLQKVIAQGEDRFESRHRRKDGSIFDVEISCQYRPTDDGQIVAFLRDITERKRAEEALREDRQRLAGIIKGTNVGTWEWNVHTGETVFNERWAEIIGYTLDEISPISIETWMKYAHPDDLKASGELLEKHFRGEIDYYEFESRMRHKDGSWVWVLDRGKVTSRTKDGKPLMMMGTHQDITAKKQAENELRESEERFFKAFKTSPYAITITHPEDGKFIEVNDAFTTMTGFTREEALADSSIGLQLWIKEEDRQHVVAVLLKKQAVVGEECLFRTKSGKVITCLFSAQVIQLVNTQCILSSINDITERKRSDEALRENRAKLEAALSSMTDAVFISDVTGKFIDFNDAFASFHRFRNKAECAKTLAEYPDIIDVFIANGELAPLEMWAVPRALRGETVTNAEYTLRRKDTGETWVGGYSFGPIRNKDGVIVGSVVVARDITESKRMEEKIRLLNERILTATRSAQVGIWDWDVVSNLLTWDDQMYELYGQKKEAFAGAYEAWLKGLHPDDRVNCDEESRRALSGEKDYDTEFRVVWPDESVHFLRAKGEVIRDADGKPIRMIGINYDITKRKREEEENTKLEAKLQQAQKMEAIGTLAGGIAHDFNNILAAIIGYTEMAADEDQKEAQQQYLQETLKGAERAKSLVKQILAFSRHDSSEKKPIDVKLLLKEAIKFLRASIPTTIEIRQHLTNESCNVVADPTHMHQIIMNLCTNAAHAMKQTGGILKIELSTLELVESEMPLYPDLRPGPYIKLAVSDTGHGVDPILHQRIFDPFFTTKPKGEGTGLGLSVVYGIVRGHDGVINVYSEPGKGASFNVYLPRIIHEEVINGNMSRDTIRGTERILFVDDEPTLVNMGTRMLFSLGYEVTGATNSLEALDLFRSNPTNFDIVITDMTLPKMTGIDLSREILQIRPDIPIILCSGIRESETEEQVKSLGIRAYCTKPLTRRELSAVIRDILDGHEKTLQ